MAITQTPSLVTQLDLPAYALGILILLFVMLVHGLVLLQVAKRYEVKSFLYLSERKYSAVALIFYLSILYLFLTHIAEIFQFTTCLGREHFICR